MGGHGSAKPSPVFPIDNREKKTRSRGVNAHTGVLRLVAITGWPLHPATDHLSPASSTGGLATWGRVLKSICSTLRVRQHTGSRVCHAACPQRSRAGEAGRPVPRQQASLSSRPLTLKGRAFASNLSLEEKLSSDVTSLTLLNSFSCCFLARMMDAAIPVVGSLPSLPSRPGRPLTYHLAGGLTPDSSLSTGRGVKRGARIWGTDTTSNVVVQIRKKD